MAVMNEDVLEAVKKRQRELNELLSKKEPEQIVVQPKSMLDEPVTPVYPDGWIKFSKKFGKPHSGIDHAIRAFKDEDWPQHLRTYIPDQKKFDGYVFPKVQGEKFVMALMHADKTLLHGPKGSGKSSLGEYVCSVLRIPFIRVNCREDMDSSAIFGSVTVKAGTMEWCPGPAEELGLHGGLLQVDEISATPPGINMAMQYMLEEDGRIYLADKPAKSEDKLIIPHAWFRVVATDNTRLQGDDTGTYTGTKVQNSAMLDRFQTTLEIGYLDAKHEGAILKNKIPELDDKIVSQMLGFANLVRTAYDEGKIQYTMSPRTLISWGKKIAYWHDTMGTLKDSFFSKLSDDDRALVDSLAFKVFGTNVK